jgi:hypothetical protein
LKLAVLLLADILVLGILADARAASVHLPPKEAAPGHGNHRRRPLETEVAIFHARWNGIPVAQAEVRAAPVTVDGRKFYEVKVSASTWKYLELIFKMRDTIESVFDPASSRPHAFIFRQRENRKVIDTHASFDPDKMKWSVSRQRGAKVKQYEFGSPHALDPISAVYLARSADFSVGDRIQMEVFGGRSRYLVSLDIEEREPISAMGKTVEAYRIVPKVVNLTRAGYAGRMRQATVWISADEKRMPLKMVSQIFVGNVSIELVPEKS